MADGRWSRPWRRRLPVMLQAARADCGPTALRMIAAFHGAPDNDHWQGDRGRHGTSLADLVAIADESGFQSRAVRLRLTDLRKLRLPAILHWNRNHFVVLAALRGGGAVVHDPASGRRRVGRDELSSSFTGVALELAPAVRFDRAIKKARGGLASVLPFFPGLARYLGLMAVLMVGVQLLNLAPAVGTQLLIDQLAAGGDRDWQYLLLGGLALILVAAAVLDAWRQFIGLRAGTHLAFDSTTAVIRHLLTLPGDYFRRRYTGDILSRLKSLAPLQAALTDDLAAVAVQASMLVTTLGVMLYYDGLLALLSLGGVVAGFAATAVTLPVRRRLLAESLAGRGREDSSLVTTLDAIESVRWFDLQGQRLRDWQRHHTSAVNAQARERRLQILTGFGTNLVAGAEQLVFLGAGVSAVLDERATLGVLFAFMSLRGRLQAAARQLLDVLSRVYVLRSHGERLADVVQAVPDHRARDAGVDRPVVGWIAAHGLGFGWNKSGASPRLLEDLDIVLEPGEHVALTGPSGCGKSTLVRLLCGQAQPDTGCVSIDGIELDLWSRRCLSKQVVVVFQDDALFDGTLADNIAGFAEAPDLGRIRQAAEAVDIWRFIRGLPMRLESRVADIAGSVSGGERQRLLLARALYRQPKILLLDEATRSLDVNSESRVLDAIAQLKCTTLHVTHRPDAVRHADRCIEL